MRATPESSGVRTETEVADAYERDATHSVRIAVADGEGWTAHDRFWLQDVPPGETGRDDAATGSKGMGPVPQIPKIHVEEFTPAVGRKRKREYFYATVQERFRVFRPEWRAGLTHRGNGGLFRR
ncbi:hypothetical protein ACWZEH_08655 [Streptomyces sp. QTS137]